MRAFSYFQVSGDNAEHRIQMMREEKYHEFKDKQENQQQVAI